MVTPRYAVAFVIIHPQISKRETVKIILESPASILVGEWLQRQRHIWTWPLCILFKCDVRHRLHCLVFTDTHLYNFTKGKTYPVNQRWRHTTCLQHPCYDVGCYPCHQQKACHPGSRRKLPLPAYQVWPELHPVVCRQYIWTGCAVFMHCAHLKCTQCLQ